IQITVDEEDFLAIACLAQHFARRVECDAVTVIIEFALLAGAVESAYKIFVEDRVADELLLPDFAGEALVGSGTRHEQDFGSIERKSARALRIVPVVAD